MNDTIEVKLPDYVSASENSLLIKKGNKWVATTKEKLLEKELKRLDELESLKHELAPLKKANELLIEDKRNNESRIALLTNLVAYLIYERNVDLGVYAESVDDDVLYDKVINNALKDIPSDLNAVLSEIKAKGVAKHD